MSKDKGISLSPIKDMELRASRIPGVVSLAQGVPSFDTPESIKRAAIEAIEKGKVAKYSLAPGLLELREVITQKLEKENKFYDFEEEVIVTAGSIEAITATMLAILSPGDEVLIPDPTYTSYQPAIVVAGGVPVFVPLDEKNHWAFDIAELEKRITPKTKAIIPVSLYGQAYDVDALREIADKHSLSVVSDNCQAIGAAFNGSRNFKDDFLVFSFYPTKNLTTAEGGALLTDNDALAEEARLWRNIGQKSKYEYVHLGYNLRMSCVHAAIGLAQMRKLDKMTEQRRSNAKLLDELLSDYVEIPFGDPRCKHVYHQYTVKTKKRDALQKHLADKGVGSGVYYPMPLHSLPTFNAQADCPETEKLCAEVLSLPVHPSLTEADVRAVADAVKSFPR